MLGVVTTLQTGCGGAVRGELMDGRAEVLRLREKLSSITLGRRLGVWYTLYRVSRAPAGAGRAS